MTTDTVNPSTINRTTPLNFTRPGPPPTLEQYVAKGDKHQRQAEHADEEKSALKRKRESSPGMYHQQVYQLPDAVEDELDVASLLYGRLVE